MANTLTPVDCYQLINSIADQALGGIDIKATDTTTFTAVGEKLLRTGTENVLNTISTVVGRTIFSTRPYKRKLSSLEVTPERWGAQTRKVVYLYQGAEQSTDYNTDIAPNQLQDGNSVDMYKINSPKAVQLNFYGTKKLQKRITRFRDQLSLAFTSEAEFMAFVSGVMTEFNNEVEIINEQRARLTVLNYIAGISSMGLMEVDLTAEYNTRFNTSYTREQLLSTQLTSFLQFMVSQIKVWSSYLTDMNFNYHANITGLSKIPRHTPKSMQKMLMYEPLFTESRAMVFSDIFNPEYLEIGAYEGVNYWQAANDRTQINITPNILDVATGNSKDAETAVEIPYVIGLLYDQDGLGVLPQFDYASTTPFNSAGGYYNMYLHWRFNSYNDFTENAVLFVMGAGGAADPGETAAVTAENVTTKFTSNGLSSSADKEGER